MSPHGSSDLRNYLYGRYYKMRNVNYKDVPINL